MMFAVLINIIAGLMIVDFISPPILLALMMGESRGRVMRFFTQ